MFLVTDISENTVYKTYSMNTIAPRLVALVVCLRAPQTQMRTRSVCIISFIDNDKEEQRRLITLQYCGRQH